MYEMTVGTFPLLFFLLLALLGIRRLFLQKTGVNIDRYLVYTFFFHVIWMILIVGMQDKMTFLVFDDQAYYQTAKGELSIEQGMYGDANAYFYILRGIYDVFGASSLNGRLLNMFISMMTIYPLAYLEYTINNNTRFRATRFFAISPFQAFIAFFEIKDIILMFSFVTSYALIHWMKSHGIRISTIVLLAMLCILNERIRSGMGVLPIAIFLLEKLQNGLGRTKLQKFLSAIIFIGIGAGVMYFFMQDYLSVSSLKVENYQKWIVNQFASSSIYNYFVITQIQDIWKLPICFALYAVQPLNALDGSNRFFGEWAMLVKFFDVPVLLMGLRWLITFMKKEKVYSLLFILPYIFLSGVNLTNARQGFFLYPILYLICFYGYEHTPLRSRGGGLCVNSRLGAQLSFVGLYIVWLLIVIVRL